MCKEWSKIDILIGSVNLATFLENNPPAEVCPGAFSETYSGYDPWGPEHFGLGAAEYLRNKGKLMIILRQPEERILCDINSKIPPPHTHTTNEADAIVYDEESQGKKGDLYHNVTEFAKVVEGCQVKSIVRAGEQGHCEDPDDPPVTDEEVLTAKRWLREGFSFVGITGFWDMSMCLINKMFENPCQNHQFTNGVAPRILFYQPGNSAGFTKYDTSVLDGYVDVYDGDIYAEALDIFNERLKEHNVTLHSCAVACQSTLANVALVEDTVVREVTALDMRTDN